MSNDSTTLNFTPPPSTVPFLLSDKFASFIVGPYGSTKTTTGIMKIAYEAARVAACRDGKRRSRYAVVRNCFDPETEIFTEQGWVRFPDLDPETAVASLHGDEMVFEVPSFHYAAPYTGKMVGVRNQAVDLLVTPDHDLWVSERRGRAKQWQPYGFMKAYEAYGKGETLRMRTTAEHTAPGTRYSTEFYEFLGFWFAEGSAGVYSYPGQTREHLRLVVSQNPRDDQYVERLLGRNGFAYGVHTKESGGNNYSLSLASTEMKLLAREFATYGKALTKTVPRKYLEGASKAQAQAFLYGYQQGDGTFKTDGHSKNVLRTASAQLKDGICEFAVLAGEMAVPSFYKNATRGWWDIVLFGGAKHQPRIAKSHWYVDEDYDDMVYCVEVSTHVVLVRRNGKAVWCSQTKQMLWDTTIPDFLKWFPDGEAGALLKSESKFILRFADVECEVLFRGLDDPNDVRRLLSLQLTGGVMDEFREIHPDIYEALAGRTGRYPDKVLVPPRPEWGVDGKGNPIGGCVQDDGAPAKRIWGMSNPPDMDTFWEELLTSPPQNASVTFQPSGVSEHADWVHLLDSGYYDNLMELHAANQDWIDVYVHAKFGKSLVGKPVFAGFNRDFHVARNTLTPIISTEHPLIVAMDFGLTPACTVSQQTPRGQYLTFAEIQSENMGVLRFCRTRLKPLLSERFPGHPVIVIGDPAGTQRSQNDEKTAFEVLRSEGFEALPAPTNNLSARIAAMEGLLAAHIDGEARHLVDPRCTQLIKGLIHGYHYKMKKTGELEPKPEKNMSSHLVEGHCYGALHMDHVFGRGALRQRHQRREVVRSRAAGWT